MIIDDSNKTNLHAGENFKNNKGEVPYGRTMTRQVSMHTLIRFNELRLNAKLCDASIVLDNGDTFPIHRSVLSGSCDYFRSVNIWLIIIVNVLTCMSVSIMIQLENRNF